MSYQQTRQLMGLSEEAGDTGFSAGNTSTWAGSNPWHIPFSPTRTVAATYASTTLTDESLRTTSSLGQDYGSISTIYPAPLELIEPSYTIATHHIALPAAGVPRRPEYDLTGVGAQFASFQFNDTSSRIARDLNVGISSNVYEYEIGPSTTLHGTSPRFESYHTRSKSSSIIDNSKVRTISEVYKHNARTPTVINQPQSPSSGTIQSSEQVSDDDDEEEEDCEPEFSDNVIGIVLASLRGDPSVPPSVRELLLQESQVFRSTAPGRGATSTRRAPAKSNKTSACTSKAFRITKPTGALLSNRDSSTPQVESADRVDEDGAKLRFACPYHKMYPTIFCRHNEIGGTGALYQSCAGPGFGNIQRLREHLRKKHGRPQCLRCLEIFAGKTELMLHRQRLEGCAWNPDRLKQEPVNDAVEERIVRTKKGEAESPWNQYETRWFRITFILFPLSIPPKSPYLGLGEKSPGVVVFRVLLEIVHDAVAADRDPNNTDILRESIPALEDILRRLAPVLQRDNDLRYRGNQSQNMLANAHAEVGASDIETNGDTEFTNIDPALLRSPEHQLLAAAPQIHGMRAPPNTNQQMGYDSTSAVEMLPLLSPASEASLDLDNFDLEVSK